MMKLLKGGSSFLLNNYILNILKILLVATFITGSLVSVAADYKLKYLLLSMCNWLFFACFSNSLFSEISKIKEFVWEVNKENDPFFLKEVRNNFLFYLIAIIALMCIFKFSLLQLFYLTALFAILIILNAELGFILCILSRKAKNGRIIVTVSGLLLYFINGYCFDINSLSAPYNKIMLIVPLNALNASIAQILKIGYTNMNILVVYNIGLIALGLLIVVHLFRNIYKLHN
ncbi:ABC-type polysaccharide/polyol phosphate export permease [Anaerobacterium chartisolvens]|uniref:ABC-type polysaccharide/polyol phosphate export permease n=1 Tax=Anaerobacterium chartisolvens TaxID=1297424 RepID=A0A369AU13_9FIRM|nr:hypothetical protein [Anaerobacterium chartisolvens]RCX12503.1 ABC-type polysaccharide/polyol phosphate export permease [Anaerobacterium chartisolvens]